MEHQRTRRSQNLVPCRADAWVAFESVFVGIALHVGVESASSVRRPVAPVGPVRFGEPIFVESAHVESMPSFLEKSVPCGCSNEMLRVMLEDKESLLHFDAFQSMEVREALQPGRCSGDSPGHWHGSSAPKWKQFALHSSSPFPPALGLRWPRSGSSEMPIR